MVQITVSGRDRSVFQGEYRNQWPAAPRGAGRFSPGFGTLQFRPRAVSTATDCGADTAH